MSRVNFFNKRKDSDFSEFMLKFQGIAKPVNLEEHDFSDSSWDAVFEEIGRHSRFEMLGKMVNAVTGQTYLRVLRYKGKCYCARYPGSFSKTDGFIFFTEIWNPDDSLRPAEEFTYFVSRRNNMWRYQPLMFSFRTAKEARKTLKKWHSVGKNEVITHNIPEK